MERAKSKRAVTDLSSDCRDGLLLAEVIEAVTNFKVPDLVKKPKTQQQMVSRQFILEILIKVKFSRHRKVDYGKFSILFSVFIRHLTSLTRFYNENLGNQYQLACFNHEDING